MADVFRWTGHFPERTRSLLRHLAERADALQQVYPRDAENRGDRRRDDAGDRAGDEPRPPRRLLSRSAVAGEAEPCAKPCRDAVSRRSKRGCAPTILIAAVRRLSIRTAVGDR